MSYLVYWASPHYSSIEVELTDNGMYVVESAERLGGGSDLRGVSTHHVPGPVVALVLPVQPDSVGEGRRLDAVVL